MCYVTHKELTLLGRKKIKILMFLYKLIFNNLKKMYILL